MSDPSPSLSSYGEGIALICIFISSSLYGLTSFQGITYFRTFPRDPWLLRLTVASVTFLVTFHIAICWHFTYRYFINDFGNYGLLFVPLWTLSATIPVTYIAKCIYHLFFLTRIWTLSGRNRVLCGLILLLEAAHVGVTMEFTTKCFQIPYWTDLISDPRTKGLATAAISLSLSCDLMITSSLCYYLHHCRTGYKRTDTLISSLILYTINSGMITAIGDLIVLGLFLGLPNNAAFIGAFEITIELCTNAILTSLNTRTRLRSRMAELTDAELCNIVHLDTTARHISLSKRGSLGASDYSKSPVSPRLNPPFSSLLKAERKISVPDKAMLRSGALHAPSHSIIHVERTIETFTDECKLEVECPERQGEHV
ncbi:hypothetical protein SISSUDRAFT_763789 [Sistotremastrum suecicum HHB10207 ss-3]|uniref:DUF6534 domain-containing protein n=1 Tax=Sistotremastrum suecicum HHB10207 ss-3 TaxID=1314776 RepID=A0A165WNB0_9AGAM|nr:hypothetical protein SISSUDRAFT_763789 [Sistotremastrum suecicum HHB10207 ss-3]